MQLIELHGTSQRHYLTSVAKLHHLCLSLLYCANKHNAQLDLRYYIGDEEKNGREQKICLLRCIRAEENRETIEI